MRGGAGSSATRARFGRGRGMIRAGEEVRERRKERGTEESSSDTRTTATLRGHGQSARETSPTDGEGCHASIAVVNGALLARLARILQRGPLIATSPRTSPVVARTRDA